DCDIDQVRKEISSRLPSYMIPNMFVQLEQLPLTPNGKLDRKALPEPSGERGQPDSYVAPRSPVEEILANIWAQVLHLDKVGIHDKFFELGGHSLLATQLVSRIRNALNREVPLRVVFESPTVAGLARELEEQRPASNLPPIVAVSREGGLPLSFAQQRLWFIDQLEPGSAAYNIPTGVRLQGALDRKALEAALTEMVRRHEVLRTT